MKETVMVVKRNHNSFFLQKIVFDYLKVEKSVI